jgi:GNAT superfamily N-acetyltransferase
VSEGEEIAMTNADLTIRAAEDSDRAALEALIAECYASVYPGWYDEETLGDALPAMLRIDPALLSSGRYLLASMGDDLAGCGGWSVGAPKTGEPPDATGHVRHFATRTDLMGKGVGGAILDRCVAEASHSGMSRLRCFSSLPAEKFYARHGFSKLGDVSVMLSDGVYFPAVLMERGLG